MEMIVSNFFEVKHSHFIDKIYVGNMKYFKHLGTEFHHFVIYTREKSVELLSYSPPEITIDNIER